MISGSYTGGVSLFNGLGHGKYGNAVPVLLSNGKPLDGNSAQAPCLGDWDGDGDLDLILGFIDGPVKYFENVGGFKFAAGREIKSGGKPIVAGDGGPCIVDWDGDGKPDLLLGDGSGSVVFYRGSGHGSLDLSEPVYLLHQSEEEAWKPRKFETSAPGGISPLRPGARSKPFAADWNGDGKLDLIVGDYLSIESSRKTLTAKEKQELARLQKQQGPASIRYSKALQSLYDRALKQSGFKSWQDVKTPEQNRKVTAVVDKLTKQDKVLQAALKEFQSINARINKLQPQVEGTGLVWVYLRK